MNDDRVSGPFSFKLPAELSAKEPPERRGLARDHVKLMVIDRAVIAREERYLERRFGDEYLEYKQLVRRWI